MSIITSRYQVGSIESNAEIYAVDSCLVTNQRVISVCFFVSDGPYLNSSIEGGASKHAGILRVDGYLHDVVFVVLIGVDLLPALIPIEEFDCLIVRATQHVWELGMHGKVPDEVCVFIDSL